jgi:protein arginine N-methyltransferase 3
MGDASSDSDVSDREYEESWVEVESGLDMPATCLFCGHTSQSVDATWKHCAEAHSFSVADFVRKHSLDNFGYIKMVNFVRRNKTEARDLAGMDSAAWSGDEYLKPVLEDDALLTFGEFSRFGAFDS